MEDEPKMRCNHYWQMNHDYEDPLPNKCSLCGKTASHEDARRFNHQWGAGKLVPNEAFKGEM